MNYKENIRKIARTTLKGMFSVLFSVLFSALVVCVSVAEAEVGEAGFLGSWIEMPMSARAAGMGDAYVSVSSGAHGLLGNPAGLSDLLKRSFLSSYRVMNIDRKLSFAAVAFPVKEEAVVSLSWMYADYGAVTVADNSGNRSDREIGLGEHQFALGFSKRFSKRLAFGATFNYYMFRFDEIHSSSVLFSGGVILFIDHFLYDRETIGQSFLSDIQVGLLVESVGSSFILNTSDYWSKYSVSSQGPSVEAEFPIRGTVGVSARALESALLVSTDLEIHQVLGPRVRFGAEYEVSSQFLLRSGLNNGALTAGAGFSFGLKNFRNLTVDYAFQTERVGEGSEHLFTLDLSF